MPLEFDSTTAEGISRRYFMKGAALVAAGVAATGLIGCKKESPTTPGETRPAETALPNEAAIQSANSELANSYGAVELYALEAFGGSANDTQRTAIASFIDNYNAAKAQIATAEAQIANNSDETTYSTADLDALKQQVADAEKKINEFQTKYNTLLLDGNDNWLASYEYLADHPNFITVSTPNAPAISGKPQMRWNYQDETPMYLFTDPNTGETTYSINLPEDAKIQVSKYVPPKGDWGQTTATGTIIDLGQVNIEGIGQGGDTDKELPTPDVRMYVFDKPNMSPAEFAASIDTTPFFQSFRYDSTPVDRFDDIWIESTEGLFLNATWGDMGGVYSGETNIGKITERNGNSEINPAQFPDSEFIGGPFYFGGQTFDELESDNQDESRFATQTYIHGRIGAQSGEGTIPKLNDPAVRKRLIDYDSNARLQPVHVTPDGVVSNY